MAYWLIKSEPGAYSWDDLVRDGGTEWDGVRNNAARLHLRTMKRGDRAFLYHSVEEKSIVGIVEIEREGRPDGAEGKWVSVRVRPIEALPQPVTLTAVKADPLLCGMELVRQSRLSVAPVSAEEWHRVRELGGL